MIIYVQCTIIYVYIYVSIYSSVELRVQQAAD